MVDDEGVVVEANRRLSEVLEAPLPSILGRRLSELVRAHHAGPSYGDRAASDRDELLVASPSGSPRFVERTATPLGGGRTLIELRAADRDEGQEPPLRAALSVEDGPLRLLAEAIPQIFWLADVDGTISYFNGRWRAYTGLPTAPVGGETWREAIHPGDVAAVARAWDRATRDATGFDTLFRLRRHDGAYRWHLGRWLAVKDVRGRVVQRFGTATDIHEQEDGLAMERLLAEVTRAFSATLDYDETLRITVRVALPELADWCALDLLGPDGALRRVAAAHANPGRQGLAEALARLEGATGAEVRSRRALETGRSESATGGDLSGEAAGEEERRLVGGLGARAVLCVPLLLRDRALGTLTFYCGDSGRGFGAREIRLAERCAKRAALAIERAELFRDAQQAVQARDLFLSIASHELRTPITAMKLQSQMMRRSLEGGDDAVLGRERVTKLVGQVERSIDRLTLLVDEMFDMSRINAGGLPIAPERVDLAGLVAEVIERFGPQLALAQIDAKVEIEAPLVGLWDRGRLEQVLTNLVTNAIKYAPRGPLVVRARRTGRGVTIEVEDGGPGIALADRARVFERFERLTSTSHTSGLGLGLYITQQIVKAHGGTVRVEGGAGIGARFVIELPETLHVHL